MFYDKLLKGISRICIRGAALRTKREYIIMVVYYMVTIRKSQVKDYVDFEVIGSIISKFLGVYPDCDLITYGLESHGKYMQLHAHLIVMMGKRIDYRKFNKCNGFIIHYRLLDVRGPGDMERICWYVHKNDWDSDVMRDQILCLNYYRYHYGFSERREVTGVLLGST